MEDNLQVVIVLFIFNSLRQFINACADVPLRWSMICVPNYHRASAMPIESDDRMRTSFPSLYCRWNPAFRDTDCCFFGEMAFRSPARTRRDTMGVYSHYYSFTESGATGTRDYIRTITYTAKDKRFLIYFSVKYTHPSHNSWIFPNFVRVHGLSMCPCDGRQLSAIHHMLLSLLPPRQPRIISCNKYPYSRPRRRHLGPTVDASIAPPGCARRTMGMGGTAMRFKTLGRLLQCPMPPSLFALHRSPSSRYQGMMPGGSTKLTTPPMMYPFASSLARGTRRLLLRARMLKLCPIMLHAR